MTRSQLSKHNIVVVPDGTKLHVHALENPTFKITCYAEELVATALRVIEQRGYDRGFAACKSQITERIFGS